MAASVITLANMKGGVGKTNTLLALCHMFSTGAHGGKPRRVGVIDLDAQANASFWLCGDMALAGLIEEGRTIDAFFEDAIKRRERVSLKDYFHTAGGHDRGIAPRIVPSCPALRTVEHDLIAFLARDKKNLLEAERVIATLLVEEIAQVRPAFDIILIDTGPGITAFTEAALRVSDAVVVPTVPDFISSLGLEAFCKTVVHSLAGAETGDPLPRVLANRVCATPQHKELLAQLRAEANAPDPGFAMFGVEIPEASECDFAEDYAERGAGADPADPHGVFTRLANELLEAIP
jgi:chromosome partitioning protein